MSSAAAKHRRISPFLKQCFVSLSISSTTIGHGFVSALPAILMIQLKEIGGQTITPDHISWTASIASPFILTGGFLISPIMGRLGRKAAHLAVSLPVLVGWLMLTFAPTFEVLMIARSLQGLSFGMMLPLRSVLIGEYTSPKNRGGFLATVPLSQGFGIFFVHFVGSLLPWRTTCFLGSLFNIFSLIIIFFSPESPSWLADKNKFEQCKEAFKWLRDDDEIEELNKLLESRTTVYNSERIKNLKDLVKVVKKKEFYKPVILMVHCYAISEFSGASLIAIYCTIILPIVVNPNIDMKFWMIMFDVNRIVTNLLGIYITRKLPRRVLMLLSSSVCAVGYAVIAGFVYFRKLEYFTCGAWVSLVLLHITYVSIVFVLGVPYVIAGEVFPLQYRSIGGSISVLSLSITYFIVTKTFPTVVFGIGLEVTFLIYSGILTYFLIVIWVFLPETKGKTLLQIEEEFRGKTLEEVTAERDEALVPMTDPGALDERKELKQDEDG